MKARDGLASARMVDAGVAVLLASDYGAPVRFQTDRELIAEIYRAMVLADRGRDLSQQDRGDGPICAMRYRVADLEGELLDAAVAKAEGLDDVTHTLVIMRDGTETFVPYGPSTHWAIGGPIIEREDWLLPYVTQVHRRHLGRYSAQTPGGFEYSGRTPLIAAMRAFVASKLGEEIELP